MRFWSVQLCRKLCLLALAALMGCVSTPALQLGDAHKQINGRFAITLMQGEQTLREQGNFEWTVSSATRMQLALKTPIGTTLAVLTLDPDRSTTQRASLVSVQQTVYADSLESLMQQHLGWVIPLPQLLPWLERNAGEPAPVPQWTVQALNRFDDGSPRVLLIENELRKLSIRMVFDATSQ